jgi:hypothetical protein
MSGKLAMQEPGSLVKILVNPETVPRNQLHPVIIPANRTGPPPAGLDPLRSPVMGDLVVPVTIVKIARESSWKGSGRGELAGVAK